MSEKRKLIKKFGSDKTRISGNGCFLAPLKKDIGRTVIVKRPCLTWDGFLGYFASDRKKEKTILAFYWAETEALK